MHALATMSLSLHLKHCLKPRLILLAASSARHIASVAASSHPNSDRQLHRQHRFARLRLLAFDSAFISAFSSATLPQPLTQSMFKLCLNHWLSLFYLNLTSELALCPCLCRCLCHHQYLVKSVPISASTEHFSPSDFTSPTLAFVLPSVSTSTSAFASTSRPPPRPRPLPRPRPMPSYQQRFIHQNVHYLPWLLPLPRLYLGLCLGLYCSLCLCLCGLCLSAFINNSLYLCLSILAAADAHTSLPCHRRAILAST